MLFGLIAQLDLIAMLCCCYYQRMRWLRYNAFRGDSRFILVHLVFTLHNYQTPRLAAYACYSTFSHSIDSTKILAGFAILYATDSILVVVDGMGGGVRRGRSCMLCFKFVVRWNFQPIQIRQTHEVRNQFPKLGFRKTTFLSSPSKQFTMYSRWC